MRTTASSVLISFNIIIIKNVARMLDKIVLVFNLLIFDNIPPQIKPRNIGPKYQKFNNDSRIPENANPLPFEYAIGSKYSTI